MAKIVGYSNPDAMGRVTFRFADGSSETLMGSAARKLIEAYNKRQKSPHEETLSLVEDRDPPRNQPRNPSGRTEDAVSMEQLDQIERDAMRQFAPGRGTPPRRNPPGMPTADQLNQIERTQTNQIQNLPRPMEEVFGGRTPTNPTQTPGWTPTMDRQGNLLQPPPPPPPLPIGRAAFPADPRDGVPGDPYFRTRQGR